MAWAGAAAQEQRKTLRLEMALARTAAARRERMPMRDGKFGTVFGLAHVLVGGWGASAFFRTPSGHVFEFALPETRALLLDSGSVA